ncbi:MAG: hypothetical protein IJ802_02410 [Kiritimatiellae bacterium]|nr:hypothetical protein [Kiritimatiellia bacterium]
MKKSLIVAMIAACAASAALAQTRRTGTANTRNLSVTKSTTTRRGPVGADGGEAVAKGRDAKVIISQHARIGNNCLQAAPSLQGGGQGPVFKKPRRWIVMEMKYDTYASWQDSLTVTWHVLLDITKATEKNKDKPKPGEKPPSQYSYYTTSVTYVNIPQGSHAASVCLPPSVLERYGEPVVISAVITNKEGDILDTQNEGAAALKLKDKWWEESEVFDLKNRDTGVPLIERRQGLVDRSKTIFALVNPNDYEVVQ